MDGINEWRARYACADLAHWHGRAHSAQAVVMGLSARDIQGASRRLHGHVLDSPWLPSRTLSAMTGCDGFLKFENLPFTASFKERGALNKIAQLSADERACGVLAVSAGNHAQGVAHHARRLGISATIVMPRFAPAVKVENTRRFGARVVPEGDTFDEARAHGLQWAKERSLTPVHPYDDLAVAAGQGRAGQGRACSTLGCWRNSLILTRWWSRSAAAA